jgi:hypothetical protein
MIVKITCISCLILLAIFILPGIAVENKTAIDKNIPVNNTIIDNNATIIDNSAVVNDSSTNSTSIGSQIANRPAIRVGMASSKPINFLGSSTQRDANNVNMYENKSNYNIGTNSKIKPTYDISAIPYIKPLHKATNIVKPILDRENSYPVKPFFNASYLVPNEVTDLSSYDQDKPIVSLEGYPRLKLPTSIA